MLNKILSASNEPLFNAATILLIFLAFVGSVLFVTILKKIYYYFRWHKRYYIVPRVGIKGITNVAMTIALSVAIILLLTVLTSGFLGIVFRAYPGWRVAIEQFLIQLGGLIFGPIIGAIIGALTDLLTIALTSGVFHYGYFFTCLICGIIAGIIKAIISFAKKDTVKFTIYSTIVILVLLVICSIYIFFQNYTLFEITLFSIAIQFSKLQLIVIVCAGAIFFVLIQWLLIFFLKHENFKLVMLMIKYNIYFKAHTDYYKWGMKNSSNRTKVSLNQARWFFKNSKRMNALSEQIANRKDLISKHLSKNNWIDTFIPVLSLAIISQIISNCILLPYFDINFSTFGFDYWLAFRTILFIPLLIFNLLIIFPTYKIVSKLVQYDYQSDIIENRDLPFME